MALTITQSQYDAATALIQQGLTGAAWASLAQDGDAYAAAASQVVNDPTSLLGEVARDTWIAAGADLSQFDNVAVAVLNNYIGNMVLQSDGTYKLPTTTQIEEGYLDALSEYGQPAYASIDADYDAANRLPSNVPPINWYEFLGIDPGRWGPPASEIAAMNANQAGNTIGASNLITSGDLLSQFVQYIENTILWFGQAQQDPLVVDLSGTGLDLTPQTSISSYFNWTGGSFANSTGWIGAGTGFLVVAPTNGGPITAANLITSFSQLQSLDTNHDGILNSSDPGFANLEVWEDTNGDGVAEPGEIFTLAQLGIQSINLGDQATSQIVAGNTVEAVSSVTMTNGSTHEIAAVAFDYSQTYTEYLGPDTPSTAAAALPQLHGYGNLPDLQEAMTNDPTLLGLVQNFAQISPTDSTALGAAIVNIMFEWAGVAGVDPTSCGVPRAARRELRPGEPGPSPGRGTRNKAEPEAVGAAAGP